MVRTATHVLSVTLLAAVLRLVAAEAYAAPRFQPELINRPGNPVGCVNEESPDSWCTVAN